MAAIKNCADYKLSLITPRLFLVPSNGISLTGTGTTFQVRDGKVYPPTIVVRAVPFGHIINQVCTFDLEATGHTLEVPEDNKAVITGDPEGSDVVTLTATISYQGVTYESSYTINKITSSTIRVYDLTTDVGSISYDTNTSTIIPTSITLNSAVSINGKPFEAYAGRFTIQISTITSTNWGTPVYSSASNESTYTYTLTGIDETTTGVRVRLHTADADPTDENVVDTTILPIIIYGYGGSSGGGRDGKIVNLYIASASPISIYSGAYIASASNLVNPVPVQAITSGFVGSQWYRWLNDEIVVSDWGTTNSTYTYYRQGALANMPDVLRVEVCDTYSGSNVAARDYITFIAADSGSTNVIAAISNEFHTIPFVNGVGDYSNSGVDFWAYEGGTALTFKAEGNSYSSSAGCYNVQRTYSNISSGGSITGTNTTKGTVPNHKDLVGLRANVTYTFRVNKQDSSVEPEINKIQIITKSSEDNDIDIIGSNDPRFFSASNLPYFTDFTDLIQTFWPGDTYTAPLYSGSIAFGHKFNGQIGSVSYLRNAYIGSLIYGTLEGSPTGPLTVTNTEAPTIYVVGVACDPMDHPVLFGIEEYTPV